MIHEKRERLEDFLIEQIHGPGSLGYRYVDLNNLGDLGNIHYSQLKGANNEEEILNTVPAAIYGTGIIFPVDNSKEGATESPEEPEEAQVLEGDVSEDSPLSPNQMYPNSFGITCCLDKAATEEGCKIFVKFRYYEKVPIKSTINYGVLLEQDMGEFENVLTLFEKESIILKHLRINKASKNIILHFAQMSSKEIDDLKTALKEEIKEIEKKAMKELGAIKDGQYFSSYKNELLNRLRGIEREGEEFQQTILKIERIESLQCTVEHIKDLYEIYSGGGYGLWKGKAYEIEVPIPEGIPRKFDHRVIKGFQHFPELRLFQHELGSGKKASISANLQFSKDSMRKDKDQIFLKVQVINTSSPYTSEDMKKGSYYSAYRETVNNRSIFGARIKVVSKHLQPFNLIQDKLNKNEKDEEKLTQFIYRKYLDYGMGHGCSIKWDKDENGQVIVESEWVPKSNVPDIEYVPRDKDNIIEENGLFIPKPYLNNTDVLGMKWLSSLSEATDEDVVDGLKGFVAKYEEWIVKNENQYNQSSCDPLVLEQLKRCQQDKERIMKNICLLEDNNYKNTLIFREMNTVMFVQLWHTLNRNDQDYLSGIMQSPDFKGFTKEFYQINAHSNIGDSSEPISWRPFQLAFILLNLDGIVEPENIKDWSNRNELVDLVWFPTGGGKTEAYLGLIAFSILYRRRNKGAKGGGTVALMRYTLRLLTLQQFQRATTLIMAIELMRRWGQETYGAEPVTIGLYVGKGQIPNTLKDLEDEYDKINCSIEKGQRITTPIPLSVCPWCGTELFKKPIDGKRKTHNDRPYEYNRVLLSCPNTSCSFHVPVSRRLLRKDQGPIPTSLCDEEIYQHPPTLLFGTVDKFAQLAHKANSKEVERHKDSRRIFGRGNWEKGKPKEGYLPPDLIIQDELHLLLGPLGSAVALFERIVDKLCTREDGTKPKIISSTATIRNANLQIRALFNRDVNIFPKSGPDCDDSYFAFFKRKYGTITGNKESFLSKRRYLGILPTGKTQIWMQMRIASIILVHRAVFEVQTRQTEWYRTTSEDLEFERAMDYYHTIVSYFNSLREVGKTSSQVDSYILKDIRRVFNRVLRPAQMMHALYTYKINDSELTGRLTGEEVKSQLQRISKPLKMSQRMRASYESVPPDFVVATNMISVGMDVSRLNIMLINSMPRNIAEYIQATSRVARNEEGVVITVHHPFRARDLSHYERFIEFHEKMYSYVEPISITPFTKKAIKRYFALCLATYLRHFAGFIDRTSASTILQYNDEKVQILIDKMLEQFYEVLKKLSNLDEEINIKNLLKEENINEMRSWLNDAIGFWKDKAAESEKEDSYLVFNNKSDKGEKKQKSLYVEIDEYSGNIENEKWKIPQSLRVVEPEAIINIRLK